MVGVSNMTENPELQTEPLPESKEKGCDELTDVRTDAKVAFKPEYDADIEEIVESHEDTETQQLIAGFALASLVTKDPVLVHYKKHHVCQNARQGNSVTTLPVKNLVQ